MDYIVTLNKDVNFPLLVEQVKALALPEYGVSVGTMVNGDKVVTVHFEVEPTNAQKAAIDALLSAHDATVKTADQEAAITIKAEIAALNLSGRNNEQVVLWLRNQINNWASLADAKQTLSLALPLMLAMILDPSLLEE